MSRAKRNAKTGKSVQRSSAATLRSNQRAYEEQKELAAAAISALTDDRGASSSSSPATVVAGHPTDGMARASQPGSKAGVYHNRERGETFSKRAGEDVKGLEDPEAEDYDEEHDDQVTLKKPKVTIRSQLAEHERLEVLRTFLLERGYPLEVVVALGNSPQELQTVVINCNAQVRAPLAANATVERPVVNNAPRIETDLSKERVLAAERALVQLPRHYNTALSVRAQAMLNLYARRLFLRVRSIPAGERGLIDSFLSCWDLDGKFRQIWNGLRSEFHKKHKRLAKFLLAGGTPTRQQVEGFLQGTLPVKGPDPQPPNSVTKLWSPMSHLETLTEQHAQISYDVVMLTVTEAFDWGTLSAYDARTRSMPWPQV